MRSPPPSVPVGLFRSLPDGVAKAILLRSCTQCHGLEKIATAAKTEAGWRATLKDMIRLGAKLKPDEDKTVIGYLVENVGPRTSAVLSRPEAASSSTNEAARDGAAADPSQLLPDGEGKGLILGACVQCHNLRYLTSQRKDAEGWRRTVHDMVARGTQVTWEEAEIIARYLAEHRSLEKK
jgi:mono/diheme cytochrome c family protein